MTNKKNQEDSFLSKDAIQDASEGAGKLVAGATVGVCKIVNAGANLLTWVGTQINNTVERNKLNGQLVDEAGRAALNKFCPNCGNAVGQTKFCSSCGTKQS
jgi:membrane protease subunit (stomatin/prohibitin family)